jgi:hypothetical protein
MLTRTSKVGMMISMKMMQMKMVTVMVIIEGRWLSTPHLEDLYA